MSLRKHAGIVSAATFLSRIFGLIRDQLFAALLGAGFYSDAFVIAFRIPNLLRDLFAEGALSSAFVPTFTEYEMKHSRQEAWKLANLVIGVLLAVLGTITLLGIVFAPALVAAIAPGFDNVPGKGELTILLTRIMFPFLPVVAISALFMGMLNVQGQFAIPAFAPVMFNIVSILFGAVLWLSGAPPRTAVIGWSIGTMVGGLAQGAIQLPALTKLGWRLRPRLREWKNNEGLRQIGKLMIPALIGLSATQINILVNSILASMLQEGSPSWLNYAFRLMQLPIGVFGVAIGMVTLPKVSRDLANESKEAFQQNLATALNLVFLLTVPAALGLWVLGIPIIRLIYQHGAFHQADTIATASALAFYSIGLPAYAAVKVVAPAFYALKDARAPMTASLVSMGLNILFNVLMYQTFGFRGLAFGTSMAAIVNFVILIAWLKTRHGGLPLGMIINRFLRIVAASVAMAFVAGLAYRFLNTGNETLVALFVQAFAPIFVGGLVYAAVLKVLRVPEMDLVTQLIRKTYLRFLSK